MTKFTETDEQITSNIVPAKESYIYVTTFRTTNVSPGLSSWEGVIPIDWTKYQIKETDMRVKTATFSSPHYIDLSKGKYAIKITSPYHENFAGLILSAEYDEKNRIYNYQCQDWSRTYQNKYTSFITQTQLYAVIRSMIALGNIPVNPSEALLKQASSLLSGLRPINHYNQEYWGSTIKFNPMSEKPDMLIKDNTYIEVIRDFMYGSGAYVDVYFNDNGIIQIEPYDKDDFFNTGLHLLKPEAIDNKFKFDITNIVTDVQVSNSEAKQDPQQILGKIYTNEILHAFFGDYSKSIRDKDVWVALGNKAEDTGTKSTSSSSGSGTASNPFKGKKIWINADSGSGTRKNEVANILKNKGYSVHVSGTGPSYHYSDYTNVPANYVYITMYNGFCAGTIQEQYSSSILNKLKNKNVTMVVMFDTYYWTEKMKPYRYGDFTGYTAKRAWDDNFSSGDPTIKNVSDFFKKHNAIYCAYPDANGLVEQFEAGGYFQWKASKG